MTRSTPARGQFLVITKQRRSVLEDSQAGQGTIPRAVGRVAIDGEHSGLGVADSKRGRWQGGSQAGTGWAGWRRDLLDHDDYSCGRLRRGRGTAGRYRGGCRLNRDGNGNPG